jgi:ATP-dependent DNA ligase
LRESGTDGPARSRVGRHPVLSRNGHDWASRYPLIVQAVNKLKVRSCLIDGEAVCCKEPSYEKLRHRSND